MLNEFDSYNGFLTEKGEKIFNSSNRSFKYGDGLFETIKIANGKILHWDYHYKRLSHGLKVLKINQDIQGKTFFYDAVQKVINRNFYKNAKIRLFVYRESPGLYTPMSNKLGFFIEGIRMDEAFYPAQINGLKIGLYNDLYKNADLLANCKTTSALVYVLAGIYKKEHKWDEVVILNQHGKVCELCASNIFVVKNDEVKTPALDQGPVNGVMRSVVLDWCTNNKINIQEGVLSIAELEDADEIFITNAVQGVRYVQSFNGGKTYSSKMSDWIQSDLKKIVMELNFK